MEKEGLHQHHSSFWDVAHHFFFDIPVDGFGAVYAFEIGTGDHFQCAIGFVGIIEVDPDGEDVLQ